MFFLSTIQSNKNVINGRGLQVIYKKKGEKKSLEDISSEKLTCRAKNIICNRHHMNDKCHISNLRESPEHMTGSLSLQSYQASADTLCP